MPDTGGRRRTLNALLLVFLVVLAFALLYAYRAQTPAVREVSFAEAVSHVETGRVQSVTITGDKAQLVLNDGQAERTTVPPGNDALERAVFARNAADPAHPISLRREAESSSLGLIASIFLSLLPIALLGLLILMAARQLARGRAPDRYDQLARLADLRDRGAITEDEFQKEKRRLLG